MNAEWWPQEEEGRDGSGADWAKISPCIVKEAISGGLW